MSEDAKATAIFDADDSRMQKTVKGIEEVLLGSQEIFKGVTESWIFEKGIESAKDFIEHLHEILGEGGHFHELGNDIGAPVKSLVILDQWAKASGRGLDEILQSLHHMQDVLGEGEKNSLVSQLGVDLQTLRSQDPVAQFRTLGLAIASLENPTDRTYAAMQLFGKEGARLLAMFKDANGFGDAARAVGEQAEILNRDAALFSYTSTKLAEAGLKTRGFFIGVADEIIPTLLPLLERFDDVDRAQSGQRVGALINSFAAADDPFDKWLTSLLEGIAKAIEILIDSVATIGVALGNMFKAAAQELVAEIEDGLAGIVGRIPGLHETAAAISEDALENHAASDRTQKRIRTGYTRTGTMDWATDYLEDRLQNMDADTLTKTSKQRAAALAAHPEIANAIGAQTLDFTMPSVSHLASIGGAFGTVHSGTTDQLAEVARNSQTSNELLIQIRDRLPHQAPGTRRVAKFPE